LEDDEDVPRSGMFMEMSWDRLGLISEYRGGGDLAQ
jgi:hypothetical protein